MCVPLVLFGVRRNYLHRVEVLPPFFDLIYDFVEQCAWNS